MTHIKLQSHDHGMQIMLLCLQQFVRTNSWQLAKMCACMCELSCRSNALTVKGTYSCQYTFFSFAMSSFLNMQKV